MTSAAYHLVFADEFSDGHSGTCRQQCVLRSSETFLVGATCSGRKTLGVNEAEKDLGGHFGRLPFTIQSNVPPRYPQARKPPQNLSVHGRSNERSVCGTFNSGSKLRLCNRQWTECQLPDGTVKAVLRHRMSLSAKCLVHRVLPSLILTVY